MLLSFLMATLSFSILPHIVYADACTDAGATSGSNAWNWCEEAFLPICTQATQNAPSNATNSCDTQVSQAVQLYNTDCPNGNGATCAALLNDTAYQQILNQANSTGQQVQQLNNCVSNGGGSGCVTSSGLIPATQQAPTPASTCTGPSCGTIQYTPLEPIPGLPSSGGVDFPTFLNALFKVLFSIGALLAVGRMVVGGIMYMTSEVTETKSNAKRWMTGSLYGLLLLAGSYLILYTINPALLNLSLNLSSNGTQTTTQPNTTTATSNTGTGGGTATNNSAGTPLTLNVPPPGQIYIYVDLSTAQQTKELNDFQAQCNGAVKPGEYGSDSGGTYLIVSCIKN